MAKAKDPAKRTVLLMSGGIDSMTTLYLLRKENFVVRILFGDYGKESNRPELAVIKSVALRFALPLDVVDLSGIPRMQLGYVPMEQVMSDELDIKDRSRGRDLRASDPVSGFHNLVSLACYYAQIINYEIITIGLIAEQRRGRPKLKSSLDQLAKAVVTMNPAATPVSIYTPLLGMRKAEVIKLAEQLKVPLSESWSCLFDRIEHCGRCVQCRERKEAFESSGIKDLTTYLE